MSCRSMSSDYSSQASPPSVPPLLICYRHRRREGGSTSPKVKCYLTKSARVCARFAAGDMLKMIAQCRLCPHARVSRSQRSAKVVLKVVPQVPELQYIPVVPGVLLQGCKVSVVPVMPNPEEQSVTTRR